MVEVTRLLSNLVKSRNIVCDNNSKKVIDYNELISEKILKIRETIEKQQDNIEQTEFIEGIDPDSVEKLLDEKELPDENELRNKADDIINRAKEDAKAIVERAKEESDLIRTDSANAGKKEGYNEGKLQAEQELEELKQSILDEKKQMELEYDQRVNEMEPMLVETILKVFSRITHVIAEDKKDLVLQLVNDVLSKTEISKEFLIRVSNDDYKFLIDNREKINGVVSKKVQIEIVEDPTFTRGQCMIESDSGIYDCSLDIQLENLVNTIKVMSCMIEE